jgi:hypothetical protein
LIFFVGIEVHKLLEEGGQTFAGISEVLGGTEGVEKPNHVQAEVSLKPKDVHKSAVKDLGRLANVGFSYP